MKALRRPDRESADEAVGRNQLSTQSLNLWTMDSTPRGATLLQFFKVPKSAQRREGNSGGNDPRFVALFALKFDSRRPTSIGSAATYVDRSRPSLPRFELLEFISEE